MVCISCIVIPLMLYIWHKFLQPIALKIWNPWAKVEQEKSESTDEAKPRCPLSNEASEMTNGKGKVD